MVDENGDYKTTIAPFNFKFLGIIGSYVPYQELAVSMQTGRPRVMFEENTGLSMVWGLAFLKEIIDSDVFQNQINQLDNLIGKHT